MDSLKQRILDYVSANQPAKVDLIYKELGICRTGTTKRPSNSASWASCAAYRVSVCSPAKNGVVAEFMQSDARKRLMMVYGRRA